MWTTPGPPTSASGSCVVLKCEHRSTRHTSVQAAGDFATSVAIKSSGVALVDEVVDRAAQRAALQLPLKARGIRQR